MSVNERILSIVFERIRMLAVSFLVLSFVLELGLSAYGLAHA